MIKPYYQDEAVTIYHGDALAMMQDMADNSVDLIATDPPYFRVKNEPWDRAWDTRDGFLSWMGELCEQWQRILKPNGSLYVFASPQMRAHVEIKISTYFHCLPTITWSKGAGWHKSSNKESLRSYFPASEAIIFAEHHGADNMAKGEAGYQAKCDELRGFVFEPLRAYLAGERDRAGWTTRKVAKAYQKKTGSRTVTGMAGHWFEQVQWSLPTAENYQWLRDLFNRTGEDYLRREYEDLRQEYEDLRRKYEDLRREYEELRRPFHVTADVPYTDVWTFPTVQAYKGKHPCEKPIDMMEHIVRASSRPGAVVLDCFGGSGTTAHAAVRLGRKAVMIEADEKWCRKSTARIKHQAATLYSIEPSTQAADTQPGETPK